MNICPNCSHHFTDDSTSEKMYLSGKWNMMLNRCYNKNNEGYKYYGGKGIKVCEEWHRFPNFREWMIENGWTNYSRLEIHRIDDNKDYCPENCALLSHRQNCRKRKSTVLNEEIVEQIIYKRFIECKTQKQIDKELNLTTGTSQQVYCEYRWSDIARKAKIKFGVYNKNEPEMYGDFI